MTVLSKRVVADETGHPTTVQMDYAEFARFEESVKGSETKSAYERMMSFAGTVDFGGEDGLEYQRRLRAEWD